MTIKDLRNKYLNFFASRDHKIIPAAPLLPENDPTVLFTTAGMHPLVPYLLGENHPSGTRLVNVQKCIRTQDIDEVGDAWHLTLFEMLGNWSLGDYFKDGAIKLSFEFLTKELGIPLNKLAFTVFGGDETNNIPPDQESFDVWRSLGVPEARIVYLKDNWWGPAGQTGPCGPDTEMFYWAGDGEAPAKFDSKDNNWVEIWNDVLMQFNKTKDGKFEELKQKNVDTGMGMDRMAAALNNKQSVYEIEPLSTIMSQVLALVNLTAEDLDKIQLKSARIITDHIRAATFILAENIEPSNMEHGYVLRRLIRRAIRHGEELGIGEKFTVRVAEVVIEQMGGYYPELRKNRNFILEQLEREEEKFDLTLERGLKEFDKVALKNEITGAAAFKLFTTYGFPLEMTRELATEKGIKVDENVFWEEFKKHQALSRQGAEKKFKGGLADNSDVTARMHTATHLMLEALRRVLGDHVYQKGSNITSERIRFDFSHGEKMTDEQRKKVEAIVNEQIEKKLPVVQQEMTLDEAKAVGAMGVFEHKYGEKVKVYSMGDFSKEICGGPHAKNTGELGKFKIQKEESSSSGVRRIKAVLE